VVDGLWLIVDGFFADGNGKFNRRWRKSFADRELEFLATRRQKPQSGFSLSSKRYDKMKESALCKRLTPFMAEASVRGAQPYPAVLARFLAGLPTAEKEHHLRITW
jgi:hypothetical protein